MTPSTDDVKTEDEGEEDSETKKKYISLKVRRANMKKKKDYFKTKKEILELLGKEIAEFLGMEKLPDEKIYQLLLKNGMDKENVMMRIKTNPHYYKKRFF